MKKASPPRYPEPIRAVEMPIPTVGVIGEQLSTLQANVYGINDDIAQLTTLLSAVLVPEKPTTKSTGEAPQPIPDGMSSLRQQILCANSSALAARRALSELVKRLEL